MGLHASDLGKESSEVKYQSQLAQISCVFLCYFVKILFLLIFIFPLYLVMNTLMVFAIYFIIFVP